MSDLEHLIAKAQSAANGGFGSLSTGEKIAVALILNRADWLSDTGYSMAEAISRVGPDWLALIPAVEKSLAKTNLVLREAARAARDAAAVESYASDGVVDVTAELVTYAEAPGYRDVSLTFDIQRLGATEKHRICLRLSPADSATVAQHIRDVHRHAWNGSPPIDIQPGETRPRWID